MLELYSYLVRNKNMYGILTSLSKSWLFKVYKGTLYVSKLVELKDLLQQVYNLMNLTFNDPDPDTEIPAIDDAQIRYRNHREHLNNPTSGLDENSTVSKNRN